MVQENHPGGNASIDYDPTPDRPLGDSTLQFLQTYKASSEFRNGYNLSNFPWLNKDQINRLSDGGQREALWVQSFADRLFGVQTLAEADHLLEPWIKWGEIHQTIWEPYYYQEPSGEDYSSKYERLKESFAKVPVPEEIREYQGDLTDEDLRSMKGLLWLTKDVKETIDLIEGLPRPVSMETIFRTQRILGRPVEPVGGLTELVVNKPSIRRVEHEGKYYIAFDLEEPADFGYEETSSDEEWQRWDQIEVGTHVNYVDEEFRSGQRIREAGIVQGFDLLGAGDAMLFAPYVAFIGIIVVNEKTGFYQCPLISNIVFDEEEFPNEKLTPEPPEPIDVVVIKPKTGEVTASTFSSIESASEAVSREISDGFERD